MWRRSAVMCLVGISGCGGGDRVAGDTIPSTAERPAAIEPSIVERPRAVEPPASDGIVVEGVKAEWQLTLPSNWVGGNYNQLAEAPARTSIERIRSLSNALREEARDMDAVAIHLGVNRRHKVTVLRINVIDPKSDLEQAPDWQVFANLEARTQEGARGEVLTVTDVVVGGRPGREAILGFTRSDGSAYFEVVGLVPLPNGRVHLFQLTAEGAVFGQRYVEFQNMMASLRYR